MLKDILTGQQMPSDRWFPEHCQTPDHLQTKTTITCLSDGGCVRLNPAWQSLGADHCLTATSMTKAMCSTHCGIGCVSEVIKWGVEWSWRGGSPDMLPHLMPWQHHALLETKPQAFSFLFPPKWQRQLFSGQQSCTFCYRTWNKEGQGKIFMCITSYSAECTNLDKETWQRAATLS